MASNTPSQKNIVYGNISAGGDVHIGDIIYHVSEDFNHSILFLRIEHISDNNYTAQLTLKSRHLGKKGLASTGLPLLVQPIQLNISSQLFQQISDFQNVRRLSGTYFRKNESATTESLRAEEEQLISLLFDTFFTGDILTVCRDFVELLEKRKIEELLLAISVYDTQIVNLPFEMVIPQFFPEKLGQTRQSLAVSHFGLVRTLEKDLEQFDMQGKAASAAPLKMLFVTALPENMVEENKMLEIEEEQKRLIDAIGSFEATGGQPKIVIEFLDTASLVKISEALQKHQHDILHISGHGSYDSKVKQGVLHLEDEEGNHCEVLGKELGETLRKHQCVKLLILSACETAIAGNGVVEQLAEFGLPSIIAMRFSVTDMGAKIFTTALYEALTKAETLTQAIAQAREKLWNYVEQARKQSPHNQYLAEWFTPVVYLNQYTEALVNLKENYVLPEDFYPRSEFLKSKNTRLIGSGFIGRKRYLNALRRSFAKGEHVCLHGLGGMGKTTLAEAFAHNYDNHSHEVIIFRNGNQITQKYILDELFTRLKADGKVNKNIVRQIEYVLESDDNIQSKLQILINNYLQNRKTILVFDNFEDLQTINKITKKQSGILRGIKKILATFCKKLKNNNKNDSLKKNKDYFKIEELDLSIFIKYLCHNTPKNCHLLFTSRYKISDLSNQVWHLTLDKLTYAEQYRLINFSTTLQKIPFRERQDIFNRLDGHPRAFEFLETLLKIDKTINWTNLAIQIGEVEDKVWEDLLLEKLYERLNSIEQQIFQICTMFVSVTPIPALKYVLKKAKLETFNLENVNTIGLCFIDNEKQTFEVHKLTREWMVKNIIGVESLKIWAFWAAEYFNEQPTWGDVELAKIYFEISESWKDFIEVSFRLQAQYQLLGFYQKALEINQVILEKTIDGKTNANALNNSGKIMAILGDNKKALKYLEKSLSISKKLGNRTDESDTLNEMSQIHTVQGNHDMSLHCLEQSFSISRENGDLKNQVAILNNFATTVYAKGDYDASLRYLEQSLSIQQQIGDSTGEGSILNNISQIYQVRGKYDTALSYLKQSLVIRQKIGDRRGEAVNLTNISKIYEVKGDHNTALQYLKKSLIIQQEIGDRKGEAATLNNLATNMQAKGSYTIAFNYLEQSLYISKETGNRKAEATALNNLATNVIRSKNDYDTGLHYFEQSLIIKQQIGDIAGLAPTLNNIGVIYLNNKNDVENAIYSFQKSFDINKQLGSPNIKYPENYLNKIRQKIGEQKFQEILLKQNQH